MTGHENSNEPSLEVLISRLDRAEFVLQQKLLTREDRARIEARAEKLRAAIAEIEDRQT